MNTAMEQQGLESENVQLFKKLSNASISLSAPLSCYYGYKATKLQKKKIKSAASVPCCTFCGHNFIPGNDRFRIQPKRKMTSKMKKLLVKETLKKQQKVCVDRFLQDRNYLKVTCSVCHKTSSFPGQSRLKREQQKSVKTASELPIEKTRKEKRKDKKRQKRKQNTDQIQDFNIATNTSHETNGVEKVRLSVNNMELQTLEQDSACRLKPQTRTSAGMLSKHNTRAQYGLTQNKLTGKNRGKNVHQQLTKMLKEEKKNKQNTSSSLKHFLSSL